MLLFVMSLKRRRAFLLLLAKGCRIKTEDKKKKHLHSFDIFGKDGQDISSFSFLLLFVYAHTAAFTACGWITNLLLQKGKRLSGEAGCVEAQQELIPDQIGGRRSSLSGRRQRLKDEK